MAYYDHIAEQWHKATGHKGGAFKERVLNDVLLAKTPGIDRTAILELGAGNGFFLPLVLRRFSGQVPSSITVTDLSKRLLEIAQRYCRPPNATYQCLDVSRTFPFADGRFDLIIASMLFNEVPERGFRKALAECRRVLSGHGLLLISVIHPEFVASLQKRGLLRRTPQGNLTMPGSGSLRQPVVIRSRAGYRIALEAAGLEYQEEDIYPTPDVLRHKPGLQKAGRVPLALVYTCTKPT